MLSSRSALGAEKREGWSSCGVSGSDLKGKKVLCMCDRNDALRTGVQAE